MSKPRLCEILGVETNERFRFKDFPNMEFEISPYGYIHYWCETKEEMDVNYLCEMIRKPEWIIHKPKWTQQDIEDAKAVRRVYPEVRAVKRIEYDAHEPELIVHFKSRPSLRINYHCFPSLKCGEEVELDEILKSEEHWKTKVLSDE